MRYSDVADRDHALPLGKVRGPGLRRFPDEKAVALHLSREPVER
jgi:hypothetical protein